MRKTWYLILPGDVLEVRMQPANTQRATERDLRDFAVAWTSRRRPGQTLSTNVAGSSQFWENFPLYGVDAPRNLLLLRLFRKHLRNNTVDLLAHPGGPAVNPKNYREFLGEESDPERADAVARALLGNSARVAPDILIGPEDLFFSSDLSFAEAKRALERLAAAGVAEEARFQQYRLRGDVPEPAPGPAADAESDRKRTRYFREVPIPARDPFCVALISDRTRARRRLFENHIRAPLEANFGIHSYRPGDPDLPSRLDDRMYSFLLRCGFVIADAGDPAPEIGFSLGLAQMLEKDIVAFAKSSAEILPIDSGRVETIRFRRPADLAAGIQRAARDLGFRPKRGTPDLSPPAPFREE